LIADRSRGRRLASADPEEAVTAEWLSASQGGEHLARSGRKSRPDEGGMEGDRGAIAFGVLDHHDEPNRPLVPGGQVVALQAIPPIERLEVRDHSIDLGVDDLARPEESDVARLTVVTGRQLELRLPGRMGQPAHQLRDRKLCGIPQRGPTHPIATNHDIEPDRISHCAQRGDADARISLLDSSLCVRRDSRAPARLRQGQRMLTTRCPDLSADRLCLSSCPARTEASRESRSNCHVPMVAIDGYRSITRRFIGVS
jgi:hypothetical protein